MGGGVGGGAEIFFLLPPMGTISRYPSEEGGGAPLPPFHSHSKPIVPTKVYYGMFAFLSQRSKEFRNF